METQVAQAQAQVTQVTQVTQESRPKKRPARVQVDPSEFEEEQPPQSGTVFNIWYNKWSGGGNNYTLVKSKHQLDVGRDCGYTKGDKQGKGYFCIFFAKGMCSKGKSCEYLHRIPEDTDVFPLTVDCFGREKFSEYRDDMSGVGSFHSVNKTLYVGGVLSNKPDVQDLLSREFGRLGKINKINVIQGKQCAFVSYKSEVSAQFAKEAMHGQSLYGEEVLSVKWAHEDPNPEAVKLKKRELEQETQQVVLQLLERHKRVQKAGVGVTDEHEPVVEEPDEPQSKETEPATRQIGPPKTPKAGILAGADLGMLALLSRTAGNRAVVTDKPLIGYESSDDDE